MVKINNENIKQGSIITQDKKKFIVLKTNKGFFYAQEIKIKSAKDILDTFTTKPKKYKLEDYVKDNNVIKSKYSDNYQIDENDKPIISAKDNKLNEIKPCCLRTMLNRVLKGKNKFGKTFCKCQNEFNLIKFEDPSHFTFSKDRKFYIADINSCEVNKYDISGKLKRLNY